jgi:hypothetical protein
MPVPICLIHNVGGLIPYNGARTRATTAYIRILDGSGTEVLGSTEATVSAITTTLAGAVSKGSQSMEVVSNVGMESGSVFYVQDDPEQFKVRVVEGTTVLLRRPAMTPHRAGATVEGTTITYTANATTASKLWWDGHAEINIDGSVFDKIAVCCAKAPMSSVLPTDDDLRAVIPLFGRGVPTEVDIEQLLELGHDRVMSRLSALAPDQRPQTFYGSAGFRHASALASAMIYYMSQRGEENKDLYERFRLDFEREVDQMVLTMPRDANQDGKIAEDERISGATIRLIA